MKAPERSEAGVLHAEIQDGLQYVFQTKSKYVLVTSGTGHSGMEACVANLLEPGETIVVGNNGIWGARVCDLSERYQGAAACLAYAAGKGSSLKVFAAGNNALLDDVQVACRMSLHEAVTG